MIYFLVTTCIFNECQIRKKQYINCICTLNSIIKKLDINNFKIIIIENNGTRETFLDLLECEIFYTNNNSLQTTNKGYKELKDILDCIEHYNICDNDFIVKITGRYILDEDSNFMKIIKDIDTVKYECIIKYGSFNNSFLVKNDCITGLIGMTCYYIKQIQIPNIDECVEWKWGEVTKLIRNENICSLEKLGINICPGSNIYYNI